MGTGLPQATAAERLFIDSDRARSYINTVATLCDHERDIARPTSLKLIVTTSI